MIPFFMDSRLLIIKNRLDEYFAKAKMIGFTRDQAESSLEIAKNDSTCRFEEIDAIDLAWKNLIEGKLA